MYWYRVVLTCLLALPAGIDMRRNQTPEQAMQSAMKAMSVIAVSGVKKCFSDQQSPEGVPWLPLAHTRPNGGNKVLRDKGLLAASISCMVTEQELTLQASHPGAAIHQFGGTIRATKSKYLSIPITKESKRVGSPRRFPRSLFFMACKSGQGGVLAERVGKKGRITIQYVLKDHVDIPARPYLGFSDATLDKIQRIMSEVLQDAILSPYIETTVV